MHAAQDVRRALRTGSPPRQLDALLHVMQDGRRALRTDARLRPPARPSTSNKAARHQLFLRAVRERLHRLGVSHTDITTLLRASGLIALTRTDRIGPSK